MKNRKLLLLLLLCVAALKLSAHSAPRYVFFFIGDGMGMNQVNGTETFLAALEGRIGTKPLRFASFPHTAIVTTFSASNGITDSSAGGTALATGYKTYNGALGVLPDSVTPVTSIGVWAKESGAAVGISTSVSVDHATPASFYAHQARRSSYYEVGLDLIRSGFDFFGGSDFLKPGGKDGKPSLYKLAQQAGYTITRSVAEFAKAKNKADRVIFLQSEAASERNRSSLAYAIDRKAGDLSLSDVTRATIDFLYKKNPQQFFCMIEGGKIDWACHSNDAATTFKEVADLDDAIGVALEFYRNHPDETLIVVTADHETGGIALGNSDYTLHSELLDYQRLSSYDYSAHLKNLRRELGNDFTFDRVKADLAEHFGFWTKITISEPQEDELEEAFEAMREGRDKNAESMYASEVQLAATAKRILNRASKMGWTSGEHTNGYVPVFAIGAGAEAFHGRIDNTDVPKIIARLAGYKLPQR